MTRRVRPFRPEEADVLRSLRLEALADNPPAFAERLEVALAMGGEDFSAPLARGEMWGVFADGEAMAMAGFGRFTGANVDHKAMIWGVYVRPQGRGSGVADQLFEALFTHAREVGVEILELGVGAFNRRAVRFYERMGFVSFGLEPAAVKLDDRYYDELLMARRL